MSQATDTSQRGMRGLAQLRLKYTRRDVELVNNLNIAITDPLRQSVYGMKQGSLAPGPELFHFSDLNVIKFHIENTYRLLIVI